MTQNHMRSFVAFVVFVAMGGCITPNSQDDKDGIEEPIFLPDGKARVTPQQTDSFEDVRTGEDPDISAVTADCVYVQWCNEPGPAGTICRLRPGCFYNTATVNECIGDTRAVCGAPVHPWYLF
jgi:hypothetical protein